MRTAAEAVCAGCGRGVLQEYKSGLTPLCSAANAKAKSKLKFTPETPLDAGPSSAGFSLNLALCTFFRIG